MSKSKEDCLYETHKDLHGQGLIKPRVLAAMDIHAKNQAIEFSEWLCANYWRREKGWSIEVHDPNVYTTEEVYSAFITHQSQSK